MSEQERPARLTPGMMAEYGRLDVMWQSLVADLDAAKRERDAWIETAREYANGLEFYRGIVQQTGAHFGPAAYTSDDGSVQDSVLALKVPELAQQVVVLLQEARSELDCPNCDNVGDFNFGHRCINCDDNVDRNMDLRKRIDTVLS